MLSIRISELPATKEIVEAFQERFSCLRCGICCTDFKGVKILKAEMKRLGVPKPEWNSTFKLINGSYYMKEPCRFYDAGKAECTIYNRRPETCRNFPVHTMHCTDGLIHLGVSDKCEAALDAMVEMEVEWLGRKIYSHAEKSHI
jgi:Fe-S-cluster containining protein